MGSQEAGSYHIVKYTPKVFSVRKHLGRGGMENIFAVGSGNLHQPGTVKRRRLTPLPQDGITVRTVTGELLGHLHTNIYARQAVFFGNFLCSELLLDLE